VFTSGLYGEREAEYAARVSLLDISVEAGESGPVVRLSGEADLSVAGQLGEALNAQVSSGARHLTVDLSGLRFADSAAIRTFGADTPGRNLGTGGNPAGDGQDL
jgi:hypothetical protein